MIDPLDVLYTFRNILRVENIEAFGMSLKFSEIIKASLPIIFVNSLEENNSSTSISYGE